MGIRVGIDTGGTFTDLVAVDEDSGSWYFGKVPSNPKNPVAAVASVLDASGVDARRVSQIVVGTTIGINAVLTRTGARVLYLATKGFEDIPYIQRIKRKHHYDLHWKKPTPLVARQDCFGVDERIGARGEVIAEVDLGSLPDERLAEIYESLGDRSDVGIAVCFLFSYLNPNNELTTREALNSRFPNIPVSLSHEVVPIWREYERGTTVTVDAYLKPLFNDYVAGASEALATRGFGGEWSLLKSNGGHVRSSEASGRPSHVLLSGVAGGAIGGAYFASVSGANEALVLDMGGTSADICLIVGGEPFYAADFEIEFDLPVSVQSVSSRTIGAGGGSIAWVDPGGLLRVGPQSAGADPGPACYARGGTAATLTDANVRLGRINPFYFAGGDIELKPDLSDHALAAIGRELGMSTDTLGVASAMVRIGNENMANAIRIVTIEKGIDPRNFTLIAAGGAGPTHAAEVADLIGIRRVVVPVNAGLCSAFGALCAEVRIDAVKSVNFSSRAPVAAVLTKAFEELESQALADFRAQGHSSAQPIVRRLVAMRYEGQNYEQEVPVPYGDFSEAELQQVYYKYHENYEKTYGYRMDAIPVEIVRVLTIVSGGREPLPVMVVGRPDEGKEGENRERTRLVYFPEPGLVSTPVVRWESLSAHWSCRGPIVVETRSSTVVVPPGWSAQQTGSGYFELEKHQEGVSCR